MNRLRLCTLLSLALWAMATFATSTTINNLTYTYNIGGAEASVKIADYNVTSVTIPATITIGSHTYQVTAIEDLGFTEEGAEPWPYSYPQKNGTEKDYNNYERYANNQLESVEFELPSNIQRIGKRAFQGCTQIKSLTIPHSVTELGENVFTGCVKLKTVEFQTDEHHRTDLKKLPKNTFWLCPEITSIELPEGIEEIDSYAFQANLALKSIILPNTLKKIGGHFLCDAKSLESLTIPASVTTIDGAFLHGCEKLRTVYLLGKAAVLQVYYQGETSSTSFGEFTETTTAPYSDKVKQCTFYVPEDYYDSYIYNDVWKKMHHDNNSDGNDIVALKDKGRSLGANKWQTIIFYKPVASYKSVFGEGCMVAELTSAKRDEADKDLYHLTFTLIDGLDIPAKKPYMIYCPYKQTHIMYTIEDESTDEFKTFFNESFYQDVAVENEPSTTISMIGKAVEMRLQPWEFYFKWNDNEQTGKFHRVPDSENAATKTVFGCYWKVLRNGIKQNVASLSQSVANKPTNIHALPHENVKTDIRIYDLQGRLIMQQADNLSQGTYIIHGKKVVIR